MTAMVEIRPVFETEDFGDELTPELREREAQMRAQTEARLTRGVAARSTARSRPSGGSSRRALIGGLVRIVRDVGLAEDLAQEALVAALEQWPESGVPDNPGAWLMAIGRHRAIDRLRRGGGPRSQDAGARARARAARRG